MSTTSLPRFGDQTPESIYRKCKDAVVRLETDDGYGTGFYAYSGQYLITAAHVLKDSKWLKVDGDPDAIDYIAFLSFENDLAILKLKKNSQKSLPFRTKPISPGEKVYVISNQLGILDDSITDGIVSSIRSDGDFVQFTASVNPGSSGAPLLDSNGQVIGAVSWKAGESEGLGFAVGLSKLRQSISVAIKAKPSITYVAKKSNAGKAAKSDRITIGTLAQTIERIPIYQERNIESKILSHAEAFQYICVASEDEEWVSIVLVNGKLGWALKESIAMLPYNVQVPKKA